jgi:putative transcriptional regulator
VEFRVSVLSGGTGCDAKEVPVTAMRNHVAELRSARGWTQGQLAERLSVSRQTVISIERGRYDPSLPLAFRIAAVFSCHIEEIFIPEPTA